MKKMITLLVAVMMLTSVTPAFAGEYADLAKKNLGEGVQDIFDGVVAIPSNFMDAHRSDEEGAFKYLKSLGTGLLETIEVGGKGLWKFGTALVPGMQIDSQ